MNRKKPFRKTVVDIKKIVNPWGNNNDKLREETENAINRSFEEPVPFKCKKCGEMFMPGPDQIIYYELCDTCFKAFDQQKMLGRYATLSKKGRHVKHYEDVDEWIKHKEN